MNLEKGLFYSFSEKVNNSMLASNAVPGTPEVFSTPALLCLIEKTAYLALQEFYDEGETSVGVSVELTHTSPTPLNMQVRCEVQVIEVNGKIVTFAVEAFDEKGFICKCKHTRAIVVKEKILYKAKKKIEQ